MKRKAPDRKREFVRLAQEFVRRGREAQQAIDDILTKVVACEWCRTRPGETHFDAQGLPLYDRQHHAGTYITPADAERISRDGP